MEIGNRRIGPGKTVLRKVYKSSTSMSGRGVSTIPRFKRPGITEEDVKIKVMKMTQQVCPQRHAVEFRKIRQVGDLWEADGTYRFPESETPRRFTIRFSMQGTVKFKDIEPP